MQPVLRVVKAELQQPWPLAWHPLCTGAAGWELATHLKSLCLLLKAADAFPFSAVLSAPCALRQLQADPLLQDARGDCNLCHEATAARNGVLPAPCSDWGEWGTAGHVLQRKAQGVAPLIEVSACDGSESSRISKLHVSESEHLNAVNLAENHTNPAAPRHDPGHPQWSSAGSVPGGGSDLAVLSGVFLPSSPVAAAHPSSVGRNHGLQGHTICTKCSCLP